MTTAAKVGTDPTFAMVQVKSNQALRVFIEYGYSASDLSLRTPVLTTKAGVTKDFVLGRLLAGAKVYYKVRYKKAGTAKYYSKKVAEVTPPAAFTKPVFAVQADPHMDSNSSDEVYSGTLGQISKAGPAFLLDLGDIFMVDKLSEKSEKNIRARYSLMRSYYRKLQGVPLKLVLGNHDGELGYSKFNTKRYRSQYFPEQTSQLSYYSFEGPDQLHICLDPFTFTTKAPKADGWQWTLGKTQYDWLKSTLEASTATYKFVYIHHLLVGDAQSRGGVEIAGLNEWGGANLDGTPGFAQNRTGWDRPVHDLLVQNKVSIVFKGHDHLYVRQELDGIVYQTVPQPSHPGDKVNPSQYGYLSGKAVGGSGFLLVETIGNVAKVKFVKFDGTTADEYEVVNS